MFFEEKIFDNLEVKKILDMVNHYNDSQKYYQSETLNNENRVEFKSKNFTKTYQTFVIPRDERTNWVFKKLRNWFEEKTNKKLLSCNLENTIHSNVFSIQRYTVGDKFNKHVDVNKTYPNNKRRFNLGILLNSEYKGGDYVLYYENNKEYIFNKEFGNAVGYDISYFHEVKEITDGERWSLVYPLYDDDFLDNKKLF